MQLCEGHFFALGVFDMRNFLKIGIIGAVALGASGSAFADDANSRFAVKGAGTKSCADFSAARAAENTDAYLYAGWVDGYLTGLNQFTPTTYDLAPWQTTDLILFKLDKYCAVMPDETFINALTGLAKILAPDRLPSESKIVSVRNGGQSIFVYEAMLPIIKQRLQEEGVAPDIKAALFTKRTANALLRYQAKHKLTQSGLPDQATLNLLFRKKAAAVEAE